MTHYVLAELQDTHPNKLLHLENILWGLEQYGKITYLSEGKEFITDVDIEAMLNAHK